MPPNPNDTPRHTPDLATTLEELCKGHTGAYVFSAFELFNGRIQVVLHDPAADADDAACRTFDRSLVEAGTLDWATMLVASLTSELQERLKVRADWEAFDTDDSLTRRAEGVSSDTIIDFAMLQRAKARAGS